MIRARIVAALPLGAAILSACSSGGHGPTAPEISRLDVASSVSAELGTQAHEPPPVIDCANDLPEAVGATEECSETDFVLGQRHGVTVRIDRLDGGVPHYSIVVGAAPLPPPEN
jgi:hypothetical protein